VISIGLTLHDATGFLQPPASGRQLLVGQQLPPLRIEDQGLYGQIEEGMTFGDTG
jgi:hypothetical protein